MSNIFNSNKPVKHNGRNGYDLSSTHALVMRPAVARPVFFQHTVPNSAYKISATDVVRTDSLQTAAFLRGKQELDFFFVPYSQLYSESNHVIFGRGELHTAALANLDETKFPSVSLPYLIECSFIPYFFMRFVYALPENSPYRYNIYDAVNIFLTSYGTSRIGSAPGTTQIRCMLYDSFTSLSEMFLNNTTYPITNFSFVGADVIQLLSTLGYGDYYPYARDIFNTSFANWNNDPERLGRSLSGYVQDFLEAMDEDYDGTVVSNGRKVNILSLLAYQKVFTDVYRDSINDDENLLYTYSSNCDYDLNTCFGIATDSRFCLLLTWLRPRLRSYHRDLSCGIYANSQFGAQAYNATVHEQASHFDFTNEQQGVGSSITATNVRFMLAMQRYRETLLRAGNRAKDLLKSEFGVESRYIQDTYCHYLGSFSGSLDLNKVSATAESGDYSVGDLAANVFSSLNGKPIDFTCNDHGVIIGILSFTPLPLHNAYGLSPFNIKFRQFDFYHEDFENLGLQPVSSHIFTPFSFEDDNSVRGNAKTLGFSARYFEYKQNLDMVHDNFQTAELMPYRNDDTVPIIEDDLPDGTNSNYVCVKPVSQDISRLRDRAYMLPNIMDTIFVASDNGDPDNAHFHVAINFSVQAVLPMSVLGLPQ